MKEFSGFDRLPFDQRPLEKRKQLLKEGLAEAALLDESLIRNADGELDQDAITVEAYTLASVIIENMWKHFRDEPGTYSTPESNRLPLTDTFWKDFADHYITVIGVEKQRVYNESEKAFTDPAVTPTQADMAAGRYMYIKILETGEPGLPSFIDFVSIYTRLARAIEEAHVQQTGEVPSRAAYEQALKNTSLHNMMAEMMLNSRDASLYLMTLLEGKGVNANTDDTSRSFDPKWFTLEGDVTEGTLALVPRAEIFEKIKPLIADLVQKRRISGSATAIKRCPVIYTGLFKEMCEWMNHEFTHHYLDQKYPVTTNPQI